MLHEELLQPRRAFLRWLGWGGWTACLAACGTSSTPAGKGQKVTMTFWTPGGGGDFCTGLDAIARDFEQHHPSITIAETQCGTGEQEFNEVLLARIAAGNPPDAAVLWTSPAALAARGALLPLDALMPQGRYAPAENWPPAVLASCRFAGKTYGPPSPPARVGSGTTGICSSTRASLPAAMTSPRAGMSYAGSRRSSPSGRETPWRSSGPFPGIP